MTSLPHIALSLRAMATRFELVLHGFDASRLRAAGEEALEQIERLEAQLNVYAADSEINWINRRAAAEPVTVEPRLFRLLQRCAGFAEQTGGTFDPSVGPLVQLWRSAAVTGTVPSEFDVDSTRQLTGMSQVVLDESNFTVRFVREGMSLDLGAYAKGYAIDRAVESLRENGVTCALLHGGTSSVFGLGAQPQSSAWKVALDAPFPVERKAVTVELCDRALSVSGVRGRSFEVAGRRYGHVIDPRSGRPVDGALAAAVAGPSAEVCEALSTALLVAGPAWLNSIADHFADYWGAVAFNRSDNQVAIEQTGPTN